MKRQPPHHDRGFVRDVEACNSKHHSATAVPCLLLLVCERQSEEGLSAVAWLLYCLSLCVPCSLRRLPMTTHDRPMTTHDRMAGVWRLARSTIMEQRQSIRRPQLPQGTSRGSSRNSLILFGSHAPLTFLSRKRAGNWPTGGRDRHFTRRVVTLHSFEQVLQFLVLPFPLREYEFRYNGTAGLAVVGLGSFHIARLFFQAENVDWRRR